MENTHTSELSLYYSTFRAGQWARRDASICPCGGSGWALSQVDTWHQCPVHFDGQRHPEDDVSATCHCGAPVGGTCICYAIGEPFVDAPDITFDAAGNRLI